MDGSFTGQDRLHTFTAYNSQTTTANLLGSAKRGHAEIGSTTNSVYYANDIFTTASCSSGSESLKLNPSSYANKPQIGDTIALFNNTSGYYAITLKTITSVSESTIRWSGAVAHEVTGATIYQGNMNVVGGSATRNINDFSPTNQSSSAGLSADIDVTSAGYPVVAYYDAENSALRVAYANSAEPKLASAWTRVDTGLSCSGEVSMRVDKNNGIHIMFKDSDGQLCYAYAASTAELGSMVAEVIDTNGSLSYGSISVKEDSSDIIPTVTYLNSANTANCIKYAYRTSAVGKDGEWDYQIIPSMGSGHYAVAENKISLESRKSGWTTTDVLTNGGTAATPATVDSVIAFKSKRFETAYLKSE